MLILTRKYVFDVLSRQILPPLVWQHFTLCFSSVVFTDPNCAFSGSGLLFSLTPLLAADFYPFLLHEDKTAIKTKLMTIRYKQWNTWQCTRSVFPAGGGGGKNSITKGTARQLQLIALFILKRIMCNFKPTDECMRICKTTTCVYMFVGGVLHCYISLLDALCALHPWSDAPRSWRGPEILPQARLHQT